MTVNHTDTEIRSTKMRGLLSVTMVLMVALMITTAETAKNRPGKAKHRKATSADCKPWRYANCVPNNRNCGPGVREGTCNGQTKKMKCSVPCNWKKGFGADCMYNFGHWGECDSATGIKSRSGTLKKVRYHSECQPTMRVSKPCPPKTQTPKPPKPKGKKGRGRRAEGELRRYGA
ncbi:hypothetical protein AAFF_G00362210 [Aldrovandia affinis]|uniref:Midkine n=1 Tax=Aldrovandia affinis TaxID=143900 RepID=A0AAD7SIT9_9TELE|nr:hypothetical protein AAFF_G00362210 [Aldrovandia affinis]